MRIDGSERAGAFWERNSKSISEKVLTSASYKFCTAPMQSIDLGPVPTQVELSVHCFPLVAEFIVKLPCASFIAGLDAIFERIEKIKRRQKI